MSHFDSSEGINKHHGSCHAVMHDRLPDEATMRSLLQSAKFAIERFIDEAVFIASWQKNMAPWNKGGRS